MSICNPCRKLKPISFCNPEGGVDNPNIINIGTAISNPELCQSEGGLFAYFKSQATGAIYTIEVTNDWDNETFVNTLSIEFQYGFPLATDMLYEFWIACGDSSIDDRVEFTIDGVTSECFLFNGTSVYNLTDGAIQMYQDQTLEVTDL